MEIYINNFLFTVLPYISIAVFIFGVISRIVFSNKSIQADSTQFFEKKKLNWGSNLFHWGIIMVFFGHLAGLFTPEALYHLIMTTKVKQILAVSMGSVFGLVALIGLIILIVRRLTNKEIRINSSTGDILLVFLIFAEVILGMFSVLKTANSSAEDYAALGHWAQSIATFQPNAGNLIAGHSILYKSHIVLGLFIFIVFPYTKLMHMIAVPIGFAFRSGWQIVRNGFKKP